MDEVLAGGVAHAGAVVRVGDEVRRPAGPQTPAVFALLDHLRARGFTGAPEPLGLDDDGRERLRFIPGDVAVRPFPAWSRTDGALASVARLLREYHDAVAGFTPPVGAAWNTELAPPDGGALLGHNDVCIENVVFRDGTAVALIDFEFAAPSTALHDLAGLARHWVPIEAPEFLARTGRDAGLDLAARLRAVADAYRLPAGPERAAFLDNILLRARLSGPFMRRRIARGERAFIDPWNASGGQARLDARLAWLEREYDALLAALNG